MVASGEVLPDRGNGEIPRTHEERYHILPRLRTMGEARGQTAQQELFQVVSSWRDGFRAQFEHIAGTKADRRRIDGRWA